MAWIDKVIKLVDKSPRCTSCDRKVYMNKEFEALCDKNKLIVVNGSLHPDPSRYSIKQKKTFGDLKGRIGFVCDANPQDRGASDGKKHLFCMYCMVKQMKNEHPDLAQLCAICGGKLEMFTEKWQIGL